jgi:hypothetical protein
MAQPKVLGIPLDANCGRMTGNPEVILKSFHEKAD